MANNGVEQQEGYSLIISPNLPNMNQINSRYVNIFSTTLSLVPDNVLTLTKTD